MKQRKKLKVLTINFGGIGDEILFLPTIKSMRQTLPDCHLTLLLEPRSRSVERITNLVDAVITFDIKKRPLMVADLIRLLGLIREGGYQIVLSSGSSKAVSMLLFLSGIERRVGYHSGRLSEFLLSDPVALNREQYAGAMYHDLATGLGAPRLAAAECVPEIQVPSENLSRMSEFLLRTAGNTTSSEQIKKILIHPGTSKLAVQKGLIKTWPVQSWIELIRLLGQHANVQILLAGGPDDKEIVEAILKDAPANAPLLSCIGATKDLADLAALIQLSDVMVCVDSAPMHMAVGLRKHLTALFGPTDEKKLLPQDPRYVALRDSTSAPLQPLVGGPGVLLPPDTVCRSVMDQLKSLSNQGSSPAHHH